VDGPGIRTTIFMKGCPLRCLWCCNPECQEFYPETNSLFPQKGERVFGKRMTVSSVMDVVSKDIPFYRNSGGGVTIAGGEPTAQPEFVLQLIKVCRQLGIHVALDTCGYTISEQASMALEQADLLLFDLKVVDPGEHLQYTGCSNELILANLKRLAELDKAVIIRIPLIPGYTDTLENIASIAQFLTAIGDWMPQQIDLLPYHKGGLIKYEMLGRKPAINSGLNPPSHEHILELKRNLEGRGFRVQPES
jgi:pyruvate formate lyase activating enzyme